ncbi:hypothetical protein [Amycolatopsis anabasis]|uniref:hypothetical protein n=1 Tax=Amycolatopsis anabasis TaxID=1840409 RepID=UPI00131C35AF|nr:hypothetical protein [Amycolatopsis anabasis]
MTNQNDALIQILPDIQRAARHIEMEWKGVVEADDIEQDIAARLLENNYATVAASLEPRALRRALFKIGVQLASGERVSYEHFSGQFRYSTGEVRERLERGALVDVGEIKVEGAPEPASVFSVEDVDVRVAADKLSVAHQNALARRYVDGLVSADATDRKTVQRAVDALTHELNREFRRAAEAHDGPGSRQAVSNAQAHVSLKRQA